MSVEACVARFEQIIGIADKLGLTHLRDSWQKQKISLRHQPVRIVILGEFNHGKSSLLNGLFGESILPFGVTPTTQLDTFIRFGASTRQVRAFAGDEEVAHWTWDAWCETNRSMPDSLRHVSVDRLEIEIDGGLFARDCIFIDTPGLNEAFLSRESYLQRYWTHADLVVFVLDANQILTHTEQVVVRELASCVERSRRILVINKCDRLDDEEWLEICAYVESSIYPFWGDSTFYMVSAKKKRIGDWDRLVSRLESDIAVQRADHEEVCIRRQNEEMSLILEGFRVLGRVLEGREEIAKSIASKPISSIELGEILHQIEGILDNAERQTSCDWDRFEKAFLGAIGRELDKALLADIEKYIEDFVDDVFACNAQTLLENQSNAIMRSYEFVWKRLGLEVGTVDGLIFSHPSLERWMKNPAPTAAFDMTNAFGLWSLPLPSVVSGVAERPRREALLKMSERAIACRSCQYRQAFEESMAHHRRVLSTWVRECGTRFEQHLSDMVSHLPMCDLGDVEMFEFER